MTVHPPRGVRPSRVKAKVQNLLTRDSATPMIQSRGSTLLPINGLHKLLDGTVFVPIWLK